MGTNAVIDICADELAGIGLTVHQEETGRFYELGETNPTDVAMLAMATVFEDRRGGTETCISRDSCEDCTAPHVEKLAQLVEDNEPLEFTMLGFPCKSPSPDKVIGTTPDLAEVISLAHINRWAQKISSFYEPGAKVIIGADGRAFADLVEVPDADITCYIAGIRQIIGKLGLQVDYIGIDELDPERASQGAFDDMRAALGDEAVSVAVLKERCRQDPDFTYQINGIERFLTEDLRHIHPEISKSQLKKIARERAYEIVARGDVLRNELELMHPNAARLSVHPQTTHGGKLGVHITPSRDDWVTPWHSSAIQHVDGSFRMIKRRIAEAEGARLTYFNCGSPSHYIAQ